VVKTTSGKEVIVVDAIGGTAYLGLPDTEELYRKYHEFRTILFGDVLPPVNHQNLTIEWSNRLKGPAGKCTVWNSKYAHPKTGLRGSAWKIQLSTKYHAKFPNQVWDTLAHEMIHMVDDINARLCKKHAGPRWIMWMNKINGMRYTVSGCDHPVLITVHADEKADTEIKWEYSCTNGECNYVRRYVRRQKPRTGYIWTCPECKTPLRERSLKKFRERS
jgi:hypothetical protein